MVVQNNGGVFLGRAKIVRRSKEGGARHVFAQLKGLHNELVFAPWGGVLANPFPGPGKIFAGDLFNMIYDDKCENPKLYVLKTYEVVSAEGTTLNLVRDGYHHVPYIGDTLMVAPAEMGGAGGDFEVIARTKTEVDGQKVWQLVLKEAPAEAPKAGDILVESDGKGKMLLDTVNASAPCDYDMVYEVTADPADDEDFENADYALTPVAGVLAYTHRMSVLPECVKKLNEAKWNGLFRIGSWL